MKTAAQALSQITSGMSLQDLMDLANEVNADVGSSTLVLYSGQVGGGGALYNAWEVSELLSTTSDIGSGKTVKTIADTEIAAFLKHQDFVDALTDAVAAPGYTGPSLSELLDGKDASGNRVNNTSFWDQASARLVDGHTGDYRLIMPGLPAGSVAAATEIPALLDKAAATGQKVNGIDLTDWQERYEVEKLISGENAARAELNDLVRAASAADLADMYVGRDGGGNLHIDTNSHLGASLGLPSEGLPSGVDPVRLSSVDGMGISAGDLTKFVKYGDLLNKAGVIGDVAGTALAMGMAIQAYNNGDKATAGEIIAGQVGGLLAGLAGGGAAAFTTGAVITGLLATTGLGVPVIMAMALTGAAGLIGGYFGGAAGEQFFKDLYKDISNMGVAPYIQSLFDGDLFPWDGPGGGVPGLSGLPSLSGLPPWFPKIGLPWEDGEGAPPPRTSPIVLDLGAAGIDLLALGTAGSVFWDIDNDDFVEETDWVGPEDGLLCIDLNSDGVINNHSELFGTATTNGYTILDGYDTNNDSSITSADTQFNDLLVWIDANSDAVSQATELHTLSSLGITSIRTSYTNVSYMIDGVQVNQQSDFTINGVTRTSVDAWFALNSTNSEYVGNYDLDVRVLFLPTLRGFGDLKDLHIAMSDNEDLLGMVQNIAVADIETLFDPAFDLRGKVADILIEWAGAGAINPDSRGGHFNAKYLEVLETFMGREFDGSSGSTDPNTYAGLYLQNAWEGLISATVGQVLGQTSGIDIFSQVGKYNPLVGQFEGSFVVDMGAIDNLLTGLEPTGLDLFSFWNNIVDLIDVTVGIDNLGSTAWGDLDDLVRDSFPTDNIGLDAFMHQIYINRKDVWPADTNVTGDANDNIMHALLGNTNITGDDGDDIILSGDGQLYAVGGEGNDTYVLSEGFGNPYYINYINESIGEGDDTIWFAGGLTSANLRSWTDSYGNFYFQINGSASDTIEIFGSLGSSGTNIHQKIEKIVFDSGEVFNFSAGLVINDTNDSHHLYGSAMADSISGNGGNDGITGFAGNDIYIFSGDFGSDYVIEQIDSGTDTVKFVGIDSADIRLYTDTNGSVHLEDKNNYLNRVTLRAGYSGGQYQSTIGQYVESVVFDDSTTWDLTGGLTIEGSSNSYESLYGTAYADSIYGYGGGDVIYANGGNDALYGGVGNDQLHGGAGNDTYYFSSGFGQDSVTENTSEGTDIIRFVGIDSADIRLYTDTNGYVHLEDKNNYLNRVTLRAAYSGGQYQSTIGQYVESVVFDDSTTWDLTGGLTIEGSSNSYESLYGTAYADSIHGLGGNDTLYGNGGNDALYGGGGNDQLYGGDSNDTLYGEAGNDTLYGGIGDDTYMLSYGFGGDAIRDYTGEGTDVIRLTGVNAADIRLWTDTNGYLHLQNKTNLTDHVTVNAAYTNTDGSYQSLIGQYVESVVFDDSTTWNLTGALRMEGASSTDTLYGTTYNDTLYGGAGNDHLYGNAGNDTLYGEAGNDTLYGGIGDDTYMLSYGFGGDAIRDYTGEGTDVIRLTGVNAADIRLWTDTNGYLHLQNKTNLTDHVTVNAAYTNTDGSYQSLIGQYVESVVFDDSTTWSLIGGLTIEGSSSADSLYGTTYNDNLSGLDGGDYIYGNTGSDIMYGNAGADYLYGGEGSDYLYGGAAADNMTGNAGADRFVFESAHAYGAIDTITDFSTSQGDSLDLVSLLGDYDPLTEAITDFVLMQTSGSNTTVSVDRDGTGNTYGWTQIATMSSVTGLTDEAALVASGNLIAA